MNMYEEAHEAFFDAYFSERLRSRTQAHNSELHDLHSMYCAGGEL